MILTKKNKLYFTIQDYVMILIGTMLYGFSFNAFILSNGIVTGGVSGICALIYFATNHLIPVSVSYFVINVVLLLVALKILGLKFLIKTIFGVFALSASLSFFEWLLHGVPLLHDQPFMSIIIGAFLCGAGLGLVFSANGSTGGTDIVAAVINKYKNISIGRALLFCDFFIIGSSFFLFHVGNFELNGYLMRQDEKPINGLIFGGEAKVVQKYRAFVLNSNNVNLIPVEEDMSHIFLINKALTDGEIVCMERIGKQTFRHRPRQVSAVVAPRISCRRS